VGSTPCRVIIKWLLQAELAEVKTGVKRRLGIETPLQVVDYLPTGKSCQVTSGCCKYCIGTKTFSQKLKISRDVEKVGPKELDLFER